MCIDCIIDRSCCIIVNPSLYLQWPQGGGPQKKWIDAARGKQGKSQLTALDEAIEQSHRNHIRPIVLQHENHMAAFSRVPDYILLMVSCEADESDEYSGNAEILWSLSAVCRRWRCLAISTSSLWSHVKLELVRWVHGRYPGSEPRP